ncbi:hypothetical protein AKG12_24965 [Agrobacterium sp. SUL3]|nr:hypothetical protein AKG12_24965 [Agrobacterium sp. SUL3]
MGRYRCSQIPPPRGRLVSRRDQPSRFLYQSGLPPRALNRFLFDFALVPSRVFGQLRLIAPSDWTPFLTNIFLHAGWLL